MEYVGIDRRIGGRSGAHSLPAARSPARVVSLLTGTGSPGSSWNWAMR